MDSPTVPMEPIPYPDIGGEVKIRDRIGAALVAFAVTLWLAGSALGLILTSRALDRIDTVIATENQIIAQHNRAAKSASRRLTSAIAEVERLLSRALAHHDREVASQLEDLLRRLRSVQFEVRDSSGDPVIIIRTIPPAPTQTKPGKGPK